MKLLDARDTRPLEGGASFSLANRAYRALWALAWTLLARWTPPPLHAWRRALLRLFGARMAPGARVHASTRVWYPPNLAMGRNTLLGPGVNCYNQGRIDIGDGVVVSQGAHLCASSHDVRDPHFQLVVRPIRIGDRAWVAAEAFIGPGVSIGEGAVIGARAALFRDAEAWGIYSGNPAVFLKPRNMRGPAAEGDEAAGV
jgi:putative colanic acid biosynthesis acetyltransferase WcaF